MTELGIQLKELAFMAKYNLQGTERNKARNNVLPVIRLSLLWSRTDRKDAIKAKWDIVCSVNKI